MNKLSQQIGQLRQFVENIPPDQFDMRYIDPADGQCGCVLFHLGRARLSDPLFRLVPSEKLSWLYDTFGLLRGQSGYPEPWGQQGKEEFLARLDQLSAGDSQ